MSFTMSVAMAERLHASGWSEWRLFPSPDITGCRNTSAIFAVFEPPAWFVPLNAAFHALGALLISGGIAVLAGDRGLIAGLIAHCCSWFFLLPWSGIAKIIKMPCRSPDTCWRSLLSPRR